MPTMKLTRRTIAAQPTPTKPTVIYDSEVKGFGLSLRPSGSRSWTCEYRPGAGGRAVAKKRVTLGDPETMTVEEARKAAKAILARVNRWADPAAERAEERAAATVADLAEEWMRRHVTIKRKPKTAQGYRSLLDCHVIPALGSRRANALTRTDLSRFHESIAQKAVVPSRSGMRRAPATRVKGGEVTANRAVAILRACLGWAVKVGELPKAALESFDGVEMFAEVERHGFLDAGHRARLGAALALAETVGLPSPTGRAVRFDSEAVAALRVLALSGCRLREVLNARWADLDMERGTLWLASAKRGARSVDLGEPALAVIRGLTRRGIYIFAGTTAGTDAERPRADLNRLWAAVCAHADLPRGTRIHDLRHNAGQRAAESGRSLHEVAALLGHSQEKTARRYARFSPSATKSIAEGVSAVLAADFGLGAGNVVDLAQRRRA